jgi:hypothetical protein
LSIFDPIRPDLPDVDERYIIYSRIRIDFYTILGCTFLLTLLATIIALLLGTCVVLKFQLDEAENAKINQGHWRPIEDADFNHVKLNTDIRNGCKLVSGIAEFLFGVTFFFVCYAFYSWRLNSKEFQQQLLKTYNKSGSANMVPLLPVPMLGRWELWRASLCLACLYYICLFQFIVLFHLFVV